MRILFTSCALFEPVIILYFFLSQNSVAKYFILILSLYLTKLNKKNQLYRFSFKKKIN